MASMRSILLVLLPAALLACSSDPAVDPGPGGSGGSLPGGSGGDPGGSGGDPGGAGGDPGGSGGDPGGSGGAGGAGGGGGGGAGGIGEGGAGAGGGGAGGGGAGGEGGADIPDPAAIEPCAFDNAPPFEPYESADGRFRIEQLFGPERDLGTEVVSNVRVSRVDPLEILVSEPQNDEGRVDILRRNDEGACEARVIRRGLDQPVRASIVDLDADGSRDLLVADIGYLFPSVALVGRVLLYEGWEEAEVEPRVLLEGVGRTTCAEPADIDDDGDLDLAVCIFGHLEGQLVWLEQKDGEFVEHVLDDRPGAIHAYPFDADGDGDLDIAAVFSQEEERVVLYRNDGLAGFGREVLFQVTSDTVEGFLRNGAVDDPARADDYGMSGLRVADLDGDEDLDLVVTNGDVLDGYIVEPDELFYGTAWLENDGTGHFMWHDLYRFSCSYSASPGDLDGDGDVDLLVTTFAGNSWHTQPVGAIWLENDGAQRFTPHEVMRQPPGLVTSATADVDGDGDLDGLAGAMFGDGTPRVYLLRNLTVP